MYNYSIFGLGDLCQIPKKSLLLKLHEIKWIRGGGL